MANSRSTILKKPPTETRHVILNLGRTGQSPGEALKYRDAWAPLQTN